MLVLSKHMLKIPFSLAGYKDFRSVSAIQERIALEKMSKGKYRNSAAIYRSLAAKYDGETLGVRLDKRIVDVEYLRFQKEKEHRIIRKIIDLDEK